MPLLRRPDRGGDGRGAWRHRANGAPRLDQGEGLAPRGAPVTDGAASPLPPERWREVFAAADHALELPEEEREAFIRQCRTDDAALGTELEALLADAEGVSALDSSAAEFAGPLLAELSSEPA